MAFAFAFEMCLPPPQNVYLSSSHICLYFTSGTNAFCMQSPLSKHYMKIMISFREIAMNILRTILSNDAILEISLHGPYYIGKIYDYLFVINFEKKLTQPVGTLGFSTIFR